MGGNGTFRLGETRPGTDAGEAAGSTPEAERQPPPRSGAAFTIGQRELEDRTSLVTVEGELDLASAPSLKWTLTDVVRAGARRRVVDLSPVTFIDSTALGVLVAVHRSLPVGSRLALAGAEAEVLNIFELTGLDSTFDMYPTLDDALAWVRESEAATG